MFLLWRCYYLSFFRHRTQQNCLVRPARGCVYAFQQKSNTTVAFDFVRFVVVVGLLFSPRFMCGRIRWTCRIKKKLLTSAINIGRCVCVWVIWEYEPAYIAWSSGSYVFVCVVCARLFIHTQKSLHIKSVRAKKQKKENIRKFRRSNRKKTIVENMWLWIFVFMNF